MASIGETLRRARLDQGLDLAQVAARTKISSRHLEAIEADNRSGLPPGGFFYKSFVHQYAGVLLMDPRELDAAVERIVSADAPLPLPGQDHPIQKLHVPPMLSARRRPFEGQRVFLSIVALVLAVVGCGGLYAWWGKADTTTVPVANETKQEPPRQEPPESHTAAIKPQDIEKVPETAVAAKAVSVFDRILVEVLAREQVWVSLTADGRRIFTGVLNAEEKRTVEARDFARLRVGNSAGLEVHWNGRPLGEIGPRGQVRVVNFSRDKFEIAMPGRFSETVFKSEPLALFDTSLNGSAAIAFALHNE